MLKYSFRCYYSDDFQNPCFSCIVPADQIYDFLDRYGERYICKVYILDESEETK